MNIYQDPKQSAEKRAKDLCGRMSLREKCGQLNQVFVGWNSYRVVDGEVELLPEFDQALSDNMVGAFYGSHGGAVIENGERKAITPRLGVKAINHIQKTAMERSRFGIPLFVSEEAPKGFRANGATTFPSPIAYGSSWNPDLMRRIGHVIAREIRAAGGHTGYAPILDICHDPRWSRIEENFGEDPYLSGRLGAAMVRGMQGDGPESADCAISTLKHFAAYGASEGGRNTGPTHMGPRELREMHLPSFRAAVQAGALSVMCSYNDIDGIPVSAHRELLTDILRGEWGFEGFVVSDALAIDELCVGNAENIKHRLAPTLAHAAALSVHAGLDVSLWDQAYLYLEEAVEKGYVDEADIDRAVCRLLRLKFRLGLFENPYVDADHAEAVMGCEEHQALSIEASRQSVILLKNNGLLPLAKDARVAVTGPNSHNLANQLGTYAPNWQTMPGFTVFEGLQECASQAENVQWALGCRVRDLDDSGIDDAVELARNSDVILAVMGGSSQDKDGVRVNPAGQIDTQSVSRTSDVDCGENIDRAGIELSGRQMLLLEKLKETGKPLLVVMIQGRPHDMRWIDANADAVLCAWYPGPYGGRAIAEAIYGELNPSGKLNTSFPKCTGQIPVNYNHRPTAEKRYLEMDTKPLYAFGHGLSYTTFAYSDLELSTQSIAADESLEASVTLTNTGKRAGTEVVQWYIRDEFASVTRPVRYLRHFERVDLEPGESKKVTFRIGPDDLACWNINMEHIVEPGEFTVFVGGDSDADLSESFVVADPKF
ncbi:MAG: glycoside hydrolase family 3 N-terminal domain-containing protein [Candidatus Sumerlaeia bacterium]